MLQGSYVINPRRAEVALPEFIGPITTRFPLRRSESAAAGLHLHHDQTDAVAVRGVAAGDPVGSGQLRPAGLEGPAHVPGGGLAHAALPAGVVRLLLSGHGGLPGRHLQRL